MNVCSMFRRVVGVRVGVVCVRIPDEKPSIVEYVVGVIVSVELLAIVDKISATANLESECVVEITLPDEFLLYIFNKPSSLFSKL